MLRRELRTSLMLPEHSTNRALMFLNDRGTPREEHYHMTDFTLLKCQELVPEFIWSPAELIIL